MENSFNRNDYYTKTDVHKMFQSVPMYELEEILESMNIDCIRIISNAHRGGKATYIKKTELEKLEPILSVQEKYFKGGFSIEMKTVFNRPIYPSVHYPAQPVKLGFWPIHSSKGIIYRVSFTRNNYPGEFFMEKVDGQWSIIKEPGAPFWILTRENEIVELLEARDLLKEVMQDIMGDFPRSEYYSQTEAIKKFKISVQTFKQLLVDNNIQVVSRRVNLGEFEVDTLYVRKTDIDQLNLQKR